MSTATLPLSLDTLPDTCVCDRPGLQCPLRSVPGRPYYPTEKEWKLCNCTLTDKQGNLSGPFCVPESKCAERRKVWYNQARGIRDPLEERFGREASVMSKGGDGPTFQGRPVPACYLEPMPLRWVSTAELARDSIALGSLLPPDVEAVVGIPRSGLLAASIIAVHLHLPLWELTDDGPRLIMSGSRGNTLPKSNGGRLAVIDDTVYSGGAMSRARHILRERQCIYAAVYCRPEASRAVDHYARPLPSPHLLEWNLLNNGPALGDARNPVYAAGIATDLDGIIVHDAESARRLGARLGGPYLPARMSPLRLIITMRPESARELTENQLRALGVKWSRLEMYPRHYEPHQHPPAGECAEYKARIYSNSGCGFFIESDPEQAELIHKMSARPVICPAAGKVWPEVVQLAPLHFRPDYQDRRRTTNIVQTQQQGRPRPQPSGPKDPPPGKGPGTYVKKMLASMGIKPNEGCDCDKFADNMDRWGVAGCKYYKDQIVAYLILQQKKKGWGATLSAGFRNLGRKLFGAADSAPVDLSNPTVEGQVKALVDEAIRRAEEDEARESAEKLAALPPDTVIPPETLRPEPKPEPRPVPPPQPTLPAQPKELTWAYGVTTVPSRRDNVLIGTLNSLRAGGFPEPWLFVDGDHDIRDWDQFLRPKGHNLNIVGRRLNVRVAGNWILAAHEIYLRFPTADRYALFQDDLVMCRNVRAYLDRCKYPDKGYWNLFTFLDAEAMVMGNPGYGPKRANGWHESPQGGRGALALVFSKEALLTLFKTGYLLERADGSDRGYRNVDGGILDGMKRADYKEYVHMPSLVEHTGRVSSFDNQPGRESITRTPSQTFPGENYDALRFLP